MKRLNDECMIRVFSFLWDSKIVDDVKVEEAINRKHDAFEKLEQKDQDKSMEFDGLQLTTGFLPKAPVRNGQRGDSSEATTSDAKKTWSITEEKQKRHDRRLDVPANKIYLLYWLLVAVSPSWRACLSGSLPELCHLYA